MSKRTERMGLVDINKLVPYENNARTHSAEQIEKIRASLREFGFVNPVLIDGNNGIIAGHGRVEAARLEGIEEVPCVWVEHLTETQKRAYILADNRLAELAGWDFNLVDFEIGSLADVGVDISITGFDFKQEDNKKFWGETEAKETEEYKEFIEKFKPKLTTDDCYTPNKVYDAVKEWALERYGLTGATVIRPFYPNGDYESEDYSGDCVVIDNPPFSLLSDICRFYAENGVRFFLFAPTLTLFSVNSGQANYLPTALQVVYDNGAIVSTSFVTNMGDFRIEVSSELYERAQAAIDEIRNEKAKELPKHDYPANVITAARCRLAKYGQDLQVRKEQAYFVRELDAQKENGKSLYGCGFLLADKAAADKAAADKAAADKAAAKKWQLSDRELEIIRQLNNGEG